MPATCDFPLPSTSIRGEYADATRAVRGRPPEAVAAAIASLADGGSRLERVPTVEVPRDGVGDMLSRLAAGGGPESPHVVVRPTD